VGERRRQIDQGAPTVDTSFRFSLALSGGGIRSATFSLGVLQAIAEAEAPLAAPPATPATPATPAPPAPSAATASGTAPAPAAPSAIAPTATARTVTAPTGTPGAAPPTPSPVAPRTFRASLLGRCDYLSTVSGGGYIGAFLCSLFKPGRVDPRDTTQEAAADRAVGILASGPPGRIRASVAAADRSESLAWLRENGRYLIPTGVGDAVYAAALGLRNWLAVHYVVGTVVIPILCLAALLRYSLSSLSDGMAAWEAQALVQALGGFAPGAAAQDTVWWSSLFVLWILPVMLWAFPVGIAFFFSYRKPVGQAAGALDAGGGGSGSGINWAVALALVIAGMLAALALWDNGDVPADTGTGSLLLLGGEGIRPLVWRAGLLSVILAVVFYWACAAQEASIARQRVLLTRWLSSALIATGAVLAFAGVETLGQTLYLWVTVQRSTAPVLTPAALVTLLVWAARRIAANSSKGGLPSWLSRLPTTTLGGLAGVAIFVLVASLWSLAITALTWNGERPEPAQASDPGHLGVTLLGFLFAVALAWVTGRFPGFINLSSLQSFYSARLMRAYLGGSNGQRFDAQDRRKSLSAAEPLPGDDLELSQFFDPPTSGSAGALSTFAPVHIINVTLNKTVDPAEQLVQRDRKGQPLAVLPFGFTVDGFDLKDFRTGPQWTEVQQPLSIGQWIGTSGAAFSTGIGRETSLGMSLLMGAANVRLGTWWESGHGTAPAHDGWWDTVTHVLREQFRTQAYLSYEFRARFFGMRRPWQYLSDGGHFENTGLYELLRPERGQPLVIASDNGADPAYHFADLANLMRLARIDLGLEVSVVRDFHGWGVLTTVFGQPEDFARDAPDAGKAAGKAAPAAASRPRPLALLLRVAKIGDTTACGWVVSLKPTVRDDAPADIRQYAIEHPAFPQEPTTDQFFDEAQWESYRSLGYWNARQVLSPQVLSELRRFMASDGKAPSA
jgi:hypothetical protein